MLSFRRALLIAGGLLTLFLLLRSTHTKTPAASKNEYNPSPTGTYDEYRAHIQSVYEKNGLTKQDQQQELEKPVENDTNTKQWNGDNGGRVALNRPKSQKPMTNLKSQSLRKQLAYAFPYDPESKFPAYIWQTWKSTPAEGTFEEKFRPTEASWTELHPSFVHEVLTDDVAASLVRHYYAGIPEVVQAYNALPIPVLKADFFRYLILLARGGIYSDIDTMALRSAVEWVPAEVPRSTYGLVVGIEADPDRPDWHEWYSRRIQFCQWTIQSKPGHPVLADVVAFIVEETLRRQTAGELNKHHLKDVMEFTGPAVWTDAIFRFFNNDEFFDMSTSTGNITWQQFTGIKQAKKVGDVIVLPITSFSPGVGQMNAGDEDDPMAFVKHNFEGSWKPEGERNIGEQH